MSRFSESVEGRYDFRPDELDHLAAIDKMDVMIDRLEAAWVELGMPMMTLGSMKQEIIHPLIAAITDHRMKRAALVARLKLPDESAPADASSGARKAAAARWSRGA